MSLSFDWVIDDNDITITFFKNFCDTGKWRLEILHKDIIYATWFKRFAGTINLDILSVKNLIMLAEHKHIFTDDKFVLEFNLMHIIATVWKFEVYKFTPPAETNICISNEFDRHICYAKIFGQQRQFVFSKITKKEKICLETYITYAIRLLTKELGCQYIPIYVKYKVNDIKRLYLEMNIKFIRKDLFLYDPSKKYILLLTTSEINGKRETKFIKF